MTEIDRSSNKLIDGIIAKLRTALCVLVPFFAVLLLWRINFDSVKLFLVRVLSDRFIDATRLVLEFLLGTQSVSVSLQILISYSFIFIGTFSFAVVILKVFKLSLDVSKLYSRTNIQTPSYPSVEYKQSFNQVFLFYSKLNI